VKKNAGFTLVEISVVGAILVSLLGLITISLVSSQQKASLASRIEVLLVDLKQQQLKAMIGDTEGRISSDSYGIHFDPDRYVLFHGLTYSSAEDSNFAIDLDNNMQFNNTEFDVIFSKLSGQISSPVIIELQDNTNSRLKRIHLNIYGTVTQIETI
jgi:type II secretory pathway pseudopilin PulG